MPEAICCNELNFLRRMILSSDRKSLPCEQQVDVNAKLINNKEEKSRAILQHMVEIKI